MTGHRETSCKVMYFFKSATKFFLMDYVIDVAISINVNLEL